MSQFLASGGQNIGVSALASVLPISIQDWYLRVDWFDLAVQRTLKGIFQHHSAKTSILCHSAFSIVPLSHPYKTTGKTIALIRWTFFGKVMHLLFNMLSRLVIDFLPRSKHLSISLLQSPPVLILKPPKIKFISFHYFPIYLPWSDGTSGEGNSTPLQYFCLENPVNGGAW